MNTNYLRYWRERAGLLQKDLVPVVEKDYRTIHRWETGKAGIKRADQEKLAAFLGITRQELIFGPGAGAQPDLGAAGFEEDAAPYDPGQLPGMALRLRPTEFLCQIKTNAVMNSRERLRPGDFAVFDIGAQALGALHAGQTPDGAIVMAQVYDEQTGSAETIIRQWIGPWPGLLVSNRPGHNDVTSLSARADIEIKGVLTRSIRGHGAAPPAPV